MGLRDSIGLWFYGMVLVVSLSVNVVLGLRLRDSPPAVKRAGFSAGELFPLLDARTPSGGARVLRFERPTLVYIFSPTCQWCEKDYQNLMAVHAVAGEKYSFVGVTMINKSAPEDYHVALADYLRRHPFPGDVLFVDPSLLAHDLMVDITVTPQMVVVDQRGRIRKAWVGALMGSRQAEVATFFNVVLPGVGS
jgi:hypothetical protein